MTISCCRYLVRTNANSPIYMNSSSVPFEDSIWAKDALPSAVQVWSVTPVAIFFRKCRMPLLSSMLHFTMILRRLGGVAFGKLVCSTTLLAIASICGYTAMLCARSEQRLLKLALSQAFNGSTSETVFSVHAAAANTRLSPAALDRFATAHV